MVLVMTYDDEERKKNLIEKILREEGNFRYLYVNHPSKNHVE